MKNKELSTPHGELETLEMGVVVDCFIRLSTPHGELETGVWWEE